MKTETANVQEANRAAAVGPVAPVLPPARRSVSNGETPKNGKPKGKGKTETPKAEVEPAAEYEDIDVVTVKNRKGRKYSLPVGLFSHTGHIIPFSNARSAMDYLRFAKVGKTKKAVKAAEAQYLEYKQTHNHMVCIAAHDGFKALDLKRCTVRRQVRIPTRRSVHIAGTTDKALPSLEVFAQATAQAAERQEKLTAKAKK